MSIPGQSRNYGEYQKYCFGIVSEHTISGTFLGNIYLPYSKFFTTGAVRKGLRIEKMVVTSYLRDVLRAPLAH